MTIIKVENLVKMYHLKEKESFWKSKKREIEAVKGISFQINKGEIVGYLGENGAGKSTTIKMLLGIIKSDKGQLKVFDKDPFTHRKQNAQRIGVLLGQKSHLWWDLPLIDSFNYLQQIYGTVTQEDKAWLTYLIDKLHIHDFLKQPVRHLSLGQRMRGEFVCAILHRPDLVILDEPTVGLDVETKHVMMELILEINELYQTTFLFTSHELTEIEKLCSRMILLQQGQIVFDGEVDKYKSQYSNLKKVVIQGDHIKFITEEGVIFNRTEVNAKIYIIDTTIINVQSIYQYLSSETILQELKIEDLDLTDILLMQQMEVHLHENA